MLLLVFIMKYILYITCIHVCYVFVRLSVWVLWFFLLVLLDIKSFYYWFWSWCVTLLWTYKFFLLFDFRLTTTTSSIHPSWMCVQQITNFMNLQHRAPHKADRQADIQRENMKKKRREIEQVSMDATSELLDTDSNATFAMVRNNIITIIKWGVEIYKLKAQNMQLLSSFLKITRSHLYVILVIHLH